MRRGSGAEKGLSLPHIWADAIEPPSLLIAEGGRLVQVKSAKLPSKEEHIYGPRGRIKDFSQDSRQRLQRKLATINEMECHLPDFLTLTYPGEWVPDAVLWKTHWHNFRRALVRQWPEVWGVWRLEFQKRGAPHFHCLLWNGPRVEGIEVWSTTKNKVIVIPKPGAISPHNQAVFDWISSTWYRIVGSGDPKHLAVGTRIEPIKSWHGVIYYASKYLAKLPEGSFVPVEYTGRFWGVVQGHKWKVSIFQKDVTDPMFYKIRRVLRKRHESLFRGKKKRRTYGKTYSGMSAYINSVDGFRLLTWSYLETHAGCPF